MRRLIDWLFRRKKKIIQEYTCKDCGNVFYRHKVVTIKDFGGLCHICNHLYKRDFIAFYYKDVKLFGAKAHLFIIAPDTTCPCCGDPLITVLIFCDGRSWAEPAKFKFPEKVKEAI